MGSKEIGIGVLLLVVLGLSEAQWQGLPKTPDLSRLQPPQQTNAVRPAPARRPSWGPVRPAPARPVPAPGRPVPAPGGPVPAPGGPVPAPAGPVPAPAGPVPAPAGPVPAPAGPVPAPAGPVPAPAGPVPAPGGPVPAPGGPVPAPGGPVPAPARPVPAPVGPLPQDPAQSSLLQDSLNVQSHQVLQGPVKNLTWRFPQAPRPTRPPPVQFELRQPAAVQGVAVACSENSIYVEVKKDLFGTGELIDPSGLTLGGCAVKGEDPAVHVLILESELQACNGALRLTEVELVYSFTLVYAPAAFTSGAPIVRTSGAVIGLECHYPRLHNVSSKALLPAWIPYASTEVGEERLVFTLRLMMDDWLFERPSNQYFFGDFINIEASVMQFNHVPLRIHLDSCVATAVPDVNSVPRYAFIGNYGCLLDAKLTGSRSHFLPQTRADKLQFQLEAFRFQQAASSLVYITCFLKANAAASPVDAEHKACSFSGKGWSAAYGDDRVCGCCDSRCSLRKGRDTSSSIGLHTQGRVTLGPIVVKDDA